MNKKLYDGFLDSKLYTLVNDSLLGFYPRAAYTNSAENSSLNSEEG
jgi:hypothetical protein